MVRSSVPRKILGVIPARFASTRFPGKVLAPIAGKTMLQHVYERASLSDYLTSMLIATDDDRVYRRRKKFRRACAHDARRPPLRHRPRGRSRLRRKCRDHRQHPGRRAADRPRRHRRRHPAHGPRTGTRHGDAQEAHRRSARNHRSQRGEGGHGSRRRCDLFLALPDSVRRGRNPAATPYFKHIGLYVYQRDFLLAYSALPVGPLETAERLEQLRALENGFRIRVVETEYESLGVDTPEDLERVSRLFDASILQGMGNG